MGSCSAPLSPSMDARSQAAQKDGSCEEIIEGYLKLHGIEPGPNEGFAITVARALWIGTSELGVRMRVNKTISSTSPTTLTASRDRSPSENHQRAHCPGSCST